MMPGKHRNIISFDICIINNLNSNTLLKTMKIKIRYVLVGVAVLVAAFSMALYFQPAEGKYDALAMCLSDKGMSMYGAYWCPHCANQKEMFGSSFKYVSYIECDPKGDNANPQLCQEKGVEGYPTWIYEGQKYEGEMTLQKISDISGCNIEN